MSKKNRDSRKHRRAIKRGDYLSVGITPPDMLYGMPLDMYLAGYRFDFNNIKYEHNAEIVMNDTSPWVPQPIKYTIPLMNSSSALLPSRQPN